MLSAYSLSGSREKHPTARELVWVDAEPSEGEKQRQQDHL